MQKKSIFLAQFKKKQYFCAQIARMCAYANMSHIRARNKTGVTKTIFYD